MPKKRHKRIQGNDLIAFQKEVIYLHQIRQLSFKVIGRMLGAHHTTILHHFHKGKSRLGDKEIVDMSDLDFIYNDLLHLNKKEVEDKPPVKGKYDDLFTDITIGKNYKDIIATSDNLTKRLYKYRNKNYS